MSEKKIAASTSCRRTGCRVISLASEGVRHASSIAVPSRAARYSGSDRPACRMNHTGTSLRALDRNMHGRAKNASCGRRPAGARKEGSQLRLCRTNEQMIESARGAAVPRGQSPRPRPRCAGTSFDRRAGRRVRARALRRVRVRCRRSCDVQPVRAVPRGRRRAGRPAARTAAAATVSERSGYTTDEVAVPSACAGRHRRRIAPVRGGQRPRVDGRRRAGDRRTGPSRAEHRPPGAAPRRAASSPCSRRRPGSRGTSRRGPAWARPVGRWSESRSTSPRRSCRTGRPCAAC